MESIWQKPADIQAVLTTIYEETLQQPNIGNVADYIPALAEVNPEQAALTVATIDGKIYSVGDDNTAFSMQSVSKVFGLVMAMSRLGDDLWSRVNMEPSGLPFNSIVQLEWEKGIPRNPVINAGAILVADVLVSHYSSSRSAIVNFIRQLADDDNIFVDQNVYQSEIEHGNLNAALAYLMKSFGNIQANVQEVLEHYFYQCSIAITAKQLAKSVVFLANKGINPITGKMVCGRRDTHKINAILSTSGMYDQSGEFAFSVGLPAKSGVGGAIVAVVPNFGVIISWSPKLNKFGNSSRAITMIKAVAEQLGLSVY